MRANRIAGCGLLLVFCLITMAARAQEIQGFSDIDYDEVDNLVVADCETVADYSAQAVYEVEVYCRIDDSNGVTVAAGDAEDDSDFGEVDVEIEADVEADTTYTVLRQRRLYTL